MTWICTFQTVEYEEKEKIEPERKIGEKGTSTSAIIVMRVGSDTFGDPIFQKGLQS